MISEHDRQVLDRTPCWDPRGGIAEQRRAWENLAIAYNQDLPAIGGLEHNVELRPGLRADVAVPKGAGRHPVVIYLHGGGCADTCAGVVSSLGWSAAVETGLFEIVKKDRAGFEALLNGRAHQRCRLA